MKKLLLGLLVCLWGLSLQAGTHTGFVNNNGIEIYYEDHGREKTQTIFMVHGYLMSGAMFREQVPALGDFFRIVTIDMRGFGHSSKDATDYSYATLVSDVQAVVNHLGLTKFHLLGHSIGSIVAELYTITYPSFVDHLILFSPFYGQLLANPSSAPTPPIASLTSPLGVDGGPISTLAFATLFAGDAFGWDVGLIDVAVPETCPASNKIKNFLFSIARQSPLNAQQNSFVAQLTPTIHSSTNPVDFDDPAQNIPTLIGGTQNPLAPGATITPSIFAPTLIIYGNDDALITVSGVEGLNRTIPNSQVLQLGGGHFTNLTQSSLFNDGVFSFLIYGKPLVKGTGSLNTCRTNF